MKWILDVYIADGETRLKIFDDEKGSTEDHRIDLDFYGYISGEDVESIIKDLRSIDEIEDAWAEEWRCPPYYDTKTRVAVFKTRNIDVLRRILRISRSKGLKIYNDYPHPLVEALYRADIRPLTMIRELERGRVKTYLWRPSYKDPEVRYVLLDFREGYYTAETRDDLQKFWDVDKLIDYLMSEYFHIGFSDPYVYMRIIEREPHIRSRAYRWVSGGAFTPHQYFEWSRLSYTPLSLMNNITIGRILTTIEALHSRRVKMLIDRSQGRRELWRNIRELIEYDRGGVVYQPRPGLYWRVCQIDFKSLYPNIIVRYNISGETVDRPLCRNILKLSWTPHKICLDDEGIVPMSIRELIHLKDLYERLYKESGDKIFSERKNAVKWILVASFGYLGYRNSLFGSVMAHETVTSTSREIMRKARLAVEKEGYKVVHAIVDSIFVVEVETFDECMFLRDKIMRETEFEAKIEAHYIWLYIPRSFVDERGVANRYYGLLTDGTWKIKGLMIVRRDTPPLIKRAQYEALQKLFEAKTPQELETKIFETKKILNKYIDMIRRREIDPRELIITRHSRTRDIYRRPPSYVLETSPPYRLVYLRKGLDLLREEESLEYDIDKYIDLLYKAWRELPTLTDLYQSKV